MISKSEADKIKRLVQIRRLTDRTLRFIGRVAAKPEQEPWEPSWPTGTAEPEIGAVVLDKDGWVWQRRVDDIDGWESLRTWYELGDGHTSVKAWGYLREAYSPLLLLTRAPSQDEIPLTEFEARNLAYALKHPSEPSPVVAPTPPEHWLAREARLAEEHLAKLPSSERLVLTRPVVGPKQSPTPEPCPCCGAPATQTEFSPNMDDYCDDCTAMRCDAYPDAHRKVSE